MGLRRVEYATEKWGDVPHYRGEAVVLGDDEHGTWLWGPVGRTIWRGDEALFVTEHAVVTLIPADEWWSLAWWIEHPALELYVNINTPAVWEPTRVVAIDLDLDVGCGRDGSVTILDRDEFEHHQRLYRYPQDIIDEAEAATARAFDLATRRVPPFDGRAAERWLEIARTADEFATEQSSP